MATASDATAQANRSGMDPKRLVVIFYLFAAVIVALILGVIAALLALTGVKSVRRATPPVPKETVDSVKEDVAWVKTQAKSGIK